MPDTAAPVTTLEVGRMLDHLRKADCPCVFAVDLADLIERMANELADGE